MLSPTGRCRTFDAARRRLRPRRGRRRRRAQAARATRCADGDPMRAVIRGTARQPRRPHHRPDAAQRARRRQRCSAQAYGRGGRRARTASPTSRRTAPAPPPATRSRRAALGRGARRRRRERAAADRLGQDQHRPPGGRRRHRRADQGGCWRCEHGRIPPILHFATPNPAHRLRRARPRACRPRPRRWPRRGAPRALAGVNSFGFGGTNATSSLLAAPRRPTGRGRSDAGGPRCRRSCSRPAPPRRSTRSRRVGRPRSRGARPALPALLRGAARRRGPPPHGSRCAAEPAPSS